MIDGLQRCEIISLGNVGVDTVDVDAATAKGIPVTNCPDTFIEEVADHAMRLMLATHGRLVEQDRMAIFPRKSGRGYILGRHFSRRRLGCGSPGPNASGGIVEALDVVEQVAAPGRDWHRPGGERARS
jgi:lactate dehydrogenase-like 2-hydroxyacid dehydrogenase